MTGETSSSRLWLAGGGLVAVLIVLASWFVVISPVRADTQDLHDQTEEVESQNAVLQASLNELKEVDAHRDELIAGVQGSLASLPSEVSLPDFNRQILNQAAGRGVELINITVGTATSPVQTGGATTTAPATTPATGQLAVPITIQTNGLMLDQLYFLRDLQEVGPRLSLITSTAFSAESETGAVDPTGNNFTLTTQLMIFSSSLTDADREQLAEVLGDDLTG